ncbi:MAG: tRNA pseudouridine(55) synthase TruB [bacterium]
MNRNLNRELNVHEGEVFLVRKPLDWTSFDVVNKMRSIFHIERIGHAGTLDRNAGGLLIVCTGKKTKEISSIQQSEKEYEVTLRLGERTESYDADTPVIERKDLSALTGIDIEMTIKKFVGWQSQLPPMWSAGKVAGRRLHAYAREGTEVERVPREGFIKSIDVQDISLPDVEMTVVCSKGMYVRSLVHDIGNALGVGAHVVSLTRSRIGDFRLADAVTIDDLIQKVYRN